MKPKPLKGKLSEVRFDGSGKTLNPPSAMFCYADIRSAVEWFFDMWSHSEFPIPPEKAKITWNLLKEAFEDVMG